MTALFELSHATLHSIMQHSLLKANVSMHSINEPTSRTLPHAMTVLQCCICLKGGKVLTCNIVVYSEVLAQ